MQRSTRYLLIAITTGFLLLTLVKTFYLTNKYGGTDLRCRIVGSRLLTTDHSPYFYQWRPGDDLRFFDPNAEPQRVVNGNVVTPATLAVIYPVSQLSYPRIRWLWTILQVLAAVAILFILFRSKHTPGRFLLASPIILGVICSDAWLYNIERGQMYIFYALLFSAMYGCYISRWKYNAFISGFIGGLFILFRPFAGIIGLAFLLQGRVKWIYGCITGFLVGCLLFVAPFTAAWTDYFKAMKEYVNENTDHGHKVVNPPPKMQFPIIEGADNVKFYRSFNLDRLDTTYHFLKRFGIQITNTQSLFLYLLVLAVMSLFFFRLRKKIVSPVTLFLFAFLVFILAELFVLAPRGGYNVIQWIFPLSLIWLHGRQHRPVVIVLVLALLLQHKFPYLFDLQDKLAEAIFIGLTLYCIYFPGSLKNTQDGIGRTG